MDDGLFGVRFSVFHNKKGAIAPVDCSSTFATAPPKNQYHRLSRWFVFRPIRARFRRWSLKTRREAHQPQRQLLAKPLGPISSCFCLLAQP